MEDKNIIESYHTESIHPGFSVDCIILGFHKGKLRILLNRFDRVDKWMLPGGFMLKDENSDQAAYKILKVRTGLKDVFLHQFHLFSDVSRTNIEENRDLASKLWPNGGDTGWLFQRFVTLGYLALVKYDKVNIPILEGEELQWHDVNKLPALYSDHQNIIMKAKEYLRTMAPIIPVGPALLPEEFAITELRKIFEIFLDVTLDRRNFQRKMLAEGYVIPVEKSEEESEEKPYNAPIMYRFNPEKKDPFNRKLF
ncbi:NrtR DNA-binding winged helix domain-containing protein [Bacteroides sp. 224]|uniref:NUDIX hydrolase n=1 Tax=Bacteroides sp. 224 TaxID=2302936 RepID=UPI0013D821EF|nr:NUDIX hydrolase [Bacteroides sp. 224]NDV66812.1 hypothetical protein [Bacteroides sp. 224]